jgi:hydrophobe/amphiphile efflux-1 (HAE1) family protein
VPGQRLNASILVQSLLKTPEEFAAVPLRTNPDGSVVKVKDIGPDRARDGDPRPQVPVQRQARPGVFAVRQEAGANALETADRVKAKMTELSKYFPPGMKAVFIYDTTPFVKVAIDEVFKTLIEAIVLVFLVMYLFLGNFRATLIPTIAVPVVLWAPSASSALLGYSINMLTMFAMVLAIGLLVDDAIVVVENVERIMSEEGLSPLEATRKSMDQITSALVGIGLVLSAVFGPMIFFPGSTGVIYRQFSVTVIASMLLSVLVALILTPVLCAALLKPVPRGTRRPRPAPRRSARSSSGSTGPSTACRDATTCRGSGTSSAGRRFATRSSSSVIVAGMAFLYRRMPTGYLPDEDQGTLMAMVQLPVGSTLEQTQAIMAEVERHFLNDQKDAVKSCGAISGLGFGGRGQNMGMVFVQLKDWKLRNRPTSGEGRGREGDAALSTIRGALIFAFPPPAVVRTRDRDRVRPDGAGPGRPRASRGSRRRSTSCSGLAAKDPRLSRVRPNGMTDVPSTRSTSTGRRRRARRPVSSVESYLSAAFGSAYVGNFVQGGASSACTRRPTPRSGCCPSDLAPVRPQPAGTGSSRSRRSPLAVGCYGSPRLERFNASPRWTSRASRRRGTRLGEAMHAMKELMAKLPGRRVRVDRPLVPAANVRVADRPPLRVLDPRDLPRPCGALRELDVPDLVMLALPLGIVGGVLASSTRGMPNDVYFQIGLLTVLGLTTKNAILIVQFATNRMERGMGLIEATIEAAKLRLRPIVMTSMAFGFGVLPLAIASGAGAGAMKAIGTSVLGGMITATFLAVFFIPLFFVLVVRVFGRKREGTPAGPAPEAARAPEGD